MGEAHGGSLMTDRPCSACVYFNSTKIVAMEDSAPRSETIRAMIHVGVGTCDLGGPDPTQGCSDVAPCDTCPAWWPKEIE